jgi:hypothetical protein
MSSENILIKLHFGVFLIYGIVNKIYSEAPE